MESDDVLPRSSVPDMSDSTTTEMHFFSGLVAGLSLLLASADLSHKIISQDGMRMLLAADIAGRIAQIGMPALGDHVAGIVAGSSDEKVFGTNAGRVVAPMQNKKTFRNGTKRHDVADTMCKQGGSSSTNADLTAACVVPGSCPDPARANLGAVSRDRTVKINLVPEAIADRYTFAATADTAALATAKLLLEPDSNAVAEVKWERLAADCALAGSWSFATLTGHGRSPEQSGCVGPRVL